VIGINLVLSYLIEKLLIPYISWSWRQYKLKELKNKVDSKEIVYNLNHLNQIKLELE